MPVLGGSHPDQPTCKAPNSKVYATRNYFVVFPQNLQSLAIVKCSMTTTCQFMPTLRFCIRFPRMPTAHRSNRVPPTLFSAVVDYKISQRRKHEPDSEQCSAPDMGNGLHTHSTTQTPPTITHMTTTDNTATYNNHNNTIQVATHCAVEKSMSLRGGAGCRSSAAQPRYQTGKSLSKFRPPMFWERYIPSGGLELHGKENKNARELWTSGADIGT